MKILILFLSILLQCAFAQDAKLPDGIKNDQNPNDQTISPLESLKKITVPEGFKVTLFAGEPDLSQPIAFTFDDRGRLWVVQNFSHPHYKKTGQDRILIFEDTDGDGQFDKKKVFWDKGQYVTGIQYGHGGIWICNSPNLQFIPDKDGDDIPDSEPINILDGWDFKGKNNIFNNLTWGPDGWLYGCIGQNGKSFVGVPGTQKIERTFMSRGLWRYHPEDKRFEVVARGAVNPWGLDFDKHGEGFFTNCVLPHAWHLIPGAYYIRRGSETDFPNIYGRIPPIADHLHWAGGHWTSSRGAKGQHSDKGGGHAHTGCMIYLGDNWPEKYKGTLFTGNIHGNRINNDLLSRKGSSYNASHGQDFLFGNHPWFRSLTQKYGPDGGVFISDWHDFGECHDHDGTHRTSGRIYKVTYGDVKKDKVNLQSLSSLKLVKLQLHKNEWYARHARRLLHERRVAGENMVAVNSALWALFKQQADIPVKLRTLWCLNQTKGLADEDLQLLLDDGNAHIRSWALRFLFDDKKVSAKILAKLKKLALTEPSPLVRLHLISQLQKLPAPSRYDILLKLVERAEDSEDRMIPKMLYYASMELVESSPELVIKLIISSKIPLVSEYLSRLLFTQKYPLFAEQLFKDLNKAQDINILASIKGINQALLRKGNLELPENWPALYKNIQAKKNGQLSFESTLLALLFKDNKANEILKDLIQDKKVASETRQKSLIALIKQKDKGLLKVLISLLDDNELQVDSIKGLASINSSHIPGILLKKFGEFTEESKAAVFTTLCSRETYTLALFKQLEDKSVPSKYLNSYHIRQIQLFKNEKMNKRLSQIWGEIKKSTADKKKEIAKFKRTLNKNFLSGGNVKNGQLVYQRTCAACHKLFGEGGTIGPDLTGSGRKDLHYILENVIDPSAIVNKNFQLVTIKTKDKRIITGTVAEETKESIVISTLNEKIILQRSDILNLEKSTKSMMPEGLFNSLSKDELRDLILYLQK